MIKFIFNPNFMVTGQFRPLDNSDPQTQTLPTQTPQLRPSQFTSLPIQAHPNQPLNNSNHSYSDPLNSSHPNSDPPNSDLPISDPSHPNPPNSDLLNSDHC